MKKLSTGKVLAVLTVVLGLAVSARAVNTCSGYQVSQMCVPAANILEGTLATGVAGSGCGATNLPQGVSITYGLTSATMTTTDTSATSLVVGGGITAGTGSVAIAGANGKLAAFDSTHYANLSGANFTAIPAAAVVAGSLGAGSFTVTGAFNATTTISAASGLSVTAGPLQPRAVSKSTLAGLTPTAGDVYTCSDCALTYDLVVATTTGSGLGNFREIGTSVKPN